MAEASGPVPGGQRPSSRKHHTDVRVRAPALLRGLPTGGGMAGRWRKPIGVGPHGMPVTIIPCLPANLATDPVEDGSRNTKFAI